MFAFDGRSQEKAEAPASSETKLPSMDQGHTTTRLVRSPRWFPSRIKIRPSSGERTNNWARIEFRRTYGETQ